MKGNANTSQMWSTNEHDIPVSCKRKNLYNPFCCINTLKYLDTLYSTSPQKVVYCSTNPPNCPNLYKLVNKCSTVYPKEDRIGKA